jgi:uncharacterized protein (TIGR03118 family)
MSLKKWALRPSLMLLAVSLMIAAPQLLNAAPGNSFGQHNLVSDLPGVAAFTDPDLVNPWGMSFSATSPIWVSDNGSGLATIYNGAGVKQGLVVTIPPAGAAAPTGQVFNPNPANFGGAHFIFATEGGTIAAWSGGTSAVQTVDNSGINSVYKGIAMGSNSSGTFLFATDFRNNAIDVFDKSFNPATLSGSFTDPGLPSGYAPFNISTVGSRVYVTYAVQDAAKHDDVAGPGHGIVDVFDTDGNFIQRLVSHGALNSPWGMAWAPAGFGQFTGDLLVGNFGDGTINGFDPATGTWLAQLDDPKGNPLTNLGLWGLAFGNGTNGTSTSSLYFTAGIPGPGMIEDHGLFGDIAATPEPGTLTLLGSGLASLIGYGWRRGKRTA